MRRCHQRDGTDSQRCHSKCRDQRHVGSRPENGGEETGGGTAGSCSRRRPVHFNSAAQQEEESRHQLHGPAGKHAAALGGLSGPEAVRPEAAEGRSQRQRGEQQRPDGLGPGEQCGDQAGPRRHRSQRWDPAREEAPGPPLEELQVLRLALLLGRPPGRGHVLVLQTVGCSVQREQTGLQVSDALSVFGKASLTSHRELHSFIPASYLWTLSHVLQVRDKDSCFFTLKCFDDSLHHFKVSPKSDPEATAKAWLQAVEEHSAYSTHYCSQEQGSEEEEHEEEAKSLGELTESLQAAEAHQEELEEEVEALVSMLRDGGLAESFPSTVTQKLQEIRVLSGETSACLRVCLGFLSRQEVVRSLRLEQQVEKNRILSEALQTLATEHHQLEQSVVGGPPPPSEDEFHDAVSESDSEASLSGFETVASRSCEDEDVMSSSSPPGVSGEDRRGDEEESQPNGTVKHRTSLPAPMFSRNDFSIWSILRNCIGMELSKITMPVIFNEPLSFLQRLTEYMEHTYLLQRANACPDSTQRMKCVAAFAVSAVASQWERTGKPFNPLLGETYELVREDLGFRLLSEQVSHHPPVSAFHAEGLQQDFVFHGSIYPKLKFWGKSVEAEPKGLITLELPKHNEAYTWTNPTCCVHNIIVGQLWIEQYGTMELLNHRTGEKCCLNFKPCGLFGKELHKVEGHILDKSRKKLCALYGKWTECLYAVEPAAFEAHKKSDKKATAQKKGGKAGSSDALEEVPSPAADTVEMIPGSQLLWRIAPRPANSTQMYSFTSFAMQLNELHTEMEASLPRTDCRLRPDIRAMENGDIDVASEEKKRLEEKQRATRKDRSKCDEEWKTRSPALGPRWFQQGPNPHTDSQDWLFCSAYWDRKYSQLPDIY
ncbi:oxysterol-binding protein-related protein 2 isoform X6 [Gasterosteus aculeatus]